MIHLGRAGATLMLDVAAATVLNVRVKGCWLLTKIGSGSGMARDAGGRLHSPDWRVTRFALVAEEGVLRGEWAGLKEARANPELMLILSGRGRPIVVMPPTTAMVISAV